MVVVHTYFRIGLPFMLIGRIIAFVKSPDLTMLDTATPILSKNPGVGAGFTSICSGATILDNSFMSTCLSLFDDIFIQ